MYIVFESSYHKIDDRYLPDTVVYTKDISGLIYPYFKCYGVVKTNGDITDYSLVFGEDEETDAIIADFIVKRRVDMEVYVEERKPHKIYSCRIDFSIAEQQAQSSLYGRSYLKYDGAVYILHVEIIKGSVFNLWLEKLLNHSSVQTMIDSSIGNIESAIDNVITLQEQYIGGTS